MKKIILLATVGLSLSACDNSGKVEAKVDSLAKGLDTSLEKLADSAKEKGGRLLDTLENKFRNLKDSAKND
jgi:hypothetical protein